MTFHVLSTFDNLSNPRLSVRKSSRVNNTRLTEWPCLTSWFVVNSRTSVQNKKPRIRLSNQNQVDLELFKFEFKTFFICSWRSHLFAFTWSDRSTSQVIFSQTRLSAQKIRGVFNYKTKSLRRRCTTWIDMHKFSIIKHEISLRHLTRCSIFQL